MASTRTTDGVEPLLHVFDALKEDRPMALLARRRVMGERMMISRVVLEKGCEVPTHLHENEQMAIVLSGRLRFGLGEKGKAGYREVTLTGEGGGQVLHLPGNLPHSAFAEERTVVLDVFSPVCEKTGIDRG
jgi:quercetin dioxygenase-like cupin family protein